MEKYKKYYGVLIFIAAVALLIFVTVKIITPKIEDLTGLKSQIEQKNKEYQSKQKSLEIVKRKIKQIKDSIVTSQKKIYSPLETDLGNETLFFTLYNDVLEMVHANSIKIKSLSYNYNPEEDAFVKFGKDVYFVCDINMDLVANYVTLGKLIQDIYQYPYYIRINEISVEAYPKDKTVLLAKLSIRLYAHTSPEEMSNVVPKE